MSVIDVRKVRIYRYLLETKGITMDKIPLDYQEVLKEAEE